MPTPNVALLLCLQSFRRPVSESTHAILKLVIRLVSHTSTSTQPHLHQAPPPVPAVVCVLGGLFGRAFWEDYLDERSNKLGKDRSDIRKAAPGFLRTYKHLIRHKTDFDIAQQEHLSLIPKDVN